MDRPAEESGGICSRCGGEVAPEADVCPHCGAVLRPVEEVLPPAEEPEETVPTDPVEETAQENSPAKGRRRLTGKAKVLIAAAAAAAVALTAVTVVLVRRSSQDTRTPLLFYKDSTLYAVSPVNWNRIIALPAENGDAYLNSAYIQYSRDGRYLYYPDSAGMDSYTLYCCDLFRGSTRMVDDEVVGFTASRRTGAPRYTAAAKSFCAAIRTAKGSLHRMSKGSCWRLTAGPWYTRRRTGRFTGAACLPGKVRKSAGRMTFITSARKQIRPIMSGIMCCITGKTAGRSRGCGRSNTGSM